MNPFELHGFAFLGFYAIVGFSLLFILHKWMSQGQDDERIGLAAREMAKDPYSIAYLRGGTAEAGRVTTVALVDRGLLEFDAKSKKLKSTKDALQMVRRPIERAVLTLYLRPQTVWHYLAPPIHASCEEYRREFLRHGLLPNFGALVQRWMLTLAIVACLVWIGDTKIHIALQQGRHNIDFLIGLEIAFSLSAIAMAARRTSGRGKALLSDLRNLFSRLKDRSDAIAPGGATNEAILLAAVFGIAALPAAKFPFITQIYTASNSGGGGGDSSSCGSSCGGGCGGGGCGG